MFFNGFPYTDYSAVNLDFLLNNVKKLKTDVDDLTKKVAGLDPNDQGGAILELQQKAAELEAAIADANRSITTLRTDVKNKEYPSFFNGRSVYIFGDSWTVGSGASDKTKTAFVPRLMVKIGASMYTNKGVGGARFTSTTNRIQDQAAGLYDDNAALVIVCGGVNDIRNQANPVSQIVDFFNTLHNQFPNAMLIFGFNMTNTRVTATAKNYIRSAIDALGSLDVGVAAFTTWESMSNSPDYFASDNLHPNDKGHGVVANLFYNAIYGGHPSAHYLSRLWSLNDGFTTSPEIDMRTFTKDGLVYTNPQIIKTSSALSEGSNTLIGTINNVASPISNVYVPIYTGNVQVGSLAITSSPSESVANVRVIATSKIPAQFYFPGVVYPMYGGAPHA